MVYYTAERRQEAKKINIRLNSYPILSVDIKYGEATEDMSLAWYRKCFDHINKAIRLACLKTGHPVFKISKELEPRLVYNGLDESICVDVNVGDAYLDKGFCEILSGTLIKEGVNLLPDVTA